MMSADIDSLVLEHLRHIRARVDQTAADVDIIKARLTSLESQGAIEFNQMQDALNKSSSVLWTLADLFGGDTENYPILDSECARRGMFIQLTSIANTLEVIRSALNEKKRPCG